MMSSRLLAALVVFSSVFATACVTKTRVIRTETLSFALDRSTPAEQERDGLTVGVRLFGPDNASAEPIVHRPATMNVRYGKSGQLRPQKADIDLLPLPFFKVTIRNHTEFELRFDRALLRVTDEAGNEYPILSKREAQEKFQSGVSNIIASQAAQGVEIQAPMTEWLGYFREIKLLSRDTSIGPESSWTGYIGFDFPNQDDPAKRAAWAKTAGKLKLQLYQIPVQTDAAGNVTKATKFEFVVQSRIDVDERTEEYKSLF